MYRRLMPVLVFFLVATVGQFSAGAQVNPGATTPVASDPINTPLIGAAPATPSATFAAPAPTAGISDAGRAGISNLAPLPTTLPSQSSTVVYVTQPPVETVTTGASGTVVENNATNPAAGAPSGTVTGSSAPSEISSGENESGGRIINDLGASYYADALPSGSNSSLGELSAQYKARKATVNARLLTNDDVQQMVANKNGVTMAKNMPPLGQGSLEQSSQAQNAGSQSATQNAQSTQQNPSANQQGQNAANSQAGTPPPAPSSKGQSAGTGVSAENSTTPQINQNQQSNDAQGSRRLPATATILPLLGLLGLVSGGIGVWFRKFRN
jgi:hypothetical protein